MIVLDTSVVSLLFRGDPRSGFYLGHMTDERTVIAFQTVEEIWYGAYRAGWGARRRNELALHLAQYEVVWPDAETVDISANLRVEREKAGQAGSTLPMHGLPLPRSGYLVPSLPTTATLTGSPNLIAH